ncbi:MAG: pentapeptide repeat-containing protein, partial [Cyanobacteria bacterium J06629_9]
NLRHAYLAETDLSDAYLGGANLREADLQGAILSSTFWEKADLQGADFSGVHDVAIANLLMAHNLELATFDGALRAQLNLRALPAPAPPALPAQIDDRDSRPIPDSR